MGQNYSESRTTAFHIIDNNRRSLVHKNAFIFNFFCPDCNVKDAMQDCDTLRGDKMRCKWTGASQRSQFRMVLRAKCIINCMLLFMQIGDYLGMRLRSLLILHRITVKKRTHYLQLTGIIGNYLAPRMARRM